MAIASRAINSSPKWIRLRNNNSFSNSRCFLTRLPVHGIADWHKFRPPASAGQPTIFVTPGTKTVSTGAAQNRGLFCRQHNKAYRCHTTQTTRAHTPSSHSVTALLITLHTLGSLRTCSISTFYFAPCSNSPIGLASTHTPPPLLRLLSVDLLSSPSPLAGFPPIYSPPTAPQPVFCRLTLRSLLSKGVQVTHAPHPWMAIASGTRSGRCFSERCRYHVPRREAGLRRRGTGYGSSARGVGRGHGAAHRHRPDRSRF